MDEALVRRHTSCRAARAALSTALELLSAATFITDRDGEIDEANKIACRELTTYGEAIRKEIYAAVRDGCDRRWVVTPTLRGSVIEGFLVVERGTTASRRVEESIRGVASNWNLSVRQADVFALICEGASNRLIAARLGITERTVEVHVTAVILKAQLESRAALIAAALAWSA